MRHVHRFETFACRLAIVYGIQIDHALFTFLARWLLNHTFKFTSRLQRRVQLSELLVLMVRIGFVLLMHLRHIYCLHRLVHFSISSLYLLYFTVFGLQPFVIYNFKCFYFVLISGWTYEGLALCVVRLKIMRYHRLSACRDVQVFFERLG